MITSQPRDEIEYFSSLSEQPLEKLLQESESLTLGDSSVVTYSRKVFIPLTQLCRDSCHYCTFAKAPKKISAPYLSRQQVLDIAGAGADAGCREALFTLGDQPEARYAVAREALATLGHSSTLGYLREMATAVLEETELLPHLNPGLMRDEDYASLRPVSVSMGLMLESISDRLSLKGMPHHGSPDKVPARRLEAIKAAGRAKVPFTTGLLIGIGETRLERIEALLAIKDIHRNYGHIQEVIVQNFRAKVGTRMATYQEPSLNDHLWTISMARLILGPTMKIQAPPNLHTSEDLAQLLRAGVNDWGGVSPVTPDHVNPEAPWPHLESLDRATSAAGRVLRERLAIGPDYARDPEAWTEPALTTVVRRSVDARGLPITDRWRPGQHDPMPFERRRGATGRLSEVKEIVGRAVAGGRLSVADITQLFEADGPDVTVLTDAANDLRRQVVGDAITYVVNRNINYTNMCLYKCGFCAFSKGTARALRGPAYRLDFDEIGERAADALARGATEVCLQGGIHPQYDGNTYLGVLRAVRARASSIHIHAFSPLEVTHGARTLGIPLHHFLAQLKEEGLSTLPGTAAEILDDDVRAIICPDKISAAEWIDVMRCAHGLGLRSTATIMFGHVDSYVHWARHLLLVRDLQEESGGFTEFVPLPFVHMEAPIWQRGQARSGPSARETLLMHAIARLALHPLIPNIQTSWVKLGEQGVIAALQSGANDLGGVLMEESITRSAGGANGQCWDAKRMAAISAAAGRYSRERTTLYQPISGLTLSKV